MAKDIAKIQEKEKAELSKWRRLAAKSPARHYIAIVLTVLVLVRVLDEFVTSAITSIQTAVVDEFFVIDRGMSFSEGLSQYSLIGTVLVLFSIAATFFVPLADRYGRKIILIISIVGMTAGMVVRYFSPDFGIFMVSGAMLTFFLGADIHQIYVTEIAPDNKRAFMINLNSCFGYLCIMLVAVARAAYTVDGELAWRQVFIAPVIIGAVLIFAMFFFVKESKVFLDKRIALLETPYAERLRIAKENKEKSRANGGIGVGFRYIFKHRQPRFLFLISLLQGAGVMAFFGFYETIMTTAGMSTENVTKALLVYPITSAFFSLIGGFAADKVGRKPVCAAYAILAFVGLFAFILGARFGLSPYAVGLFYGTEIGCFWAYGNLVNLVQSESVSTEVRASAKAAAGLASLLVTMISSVIISALVNFVDLGMLCLIWGAGFLGTSMLLFMLKIKETKGVDLSVPMVDGK